jgi:hypothetical protein
MNKKQENILQELNNKYPVSTWVENKDDGTVLVQFDDGDEAVIEPDGEFEIWSSYS